MIVSEPSTDLVITCMHCGYNIRDAKNILYEFLKTIGVDEEDIEWRGD